MRLPKFNFSINLVTIIRLFRRYILGIKPVDHSRKLLLKRDKWDERDFIYKVRQHYVQIPESTNDENLKQFNLVYNQDQLGSCGMNAYMAVFRRVLQVNG